MNVKAAFVEVYGIGLAAVIGPREEDIVFIVIFAYLCDTGVICSIWHVERLTLRACVAAPRIPARRVDHSHTQSQMGLQRRMAIDAWLEPHPGPGN